MSENKFIARLKGELTPKSVVEIQNDRLVAPFKSSPMGHIADRDSSVVVAKGAQNWAVNQGQLVPVADDYVGTENDLSGTSRVSGAGLWLNATYTFPATGDETNPVSAIIAPSAKWVLTLCGDSLITQNGSVITLTMLVKIGATHLTTKQFKIRECASQFSQRLAIDFSESEQKVIKAHGGSPLTVQVLCDDEGASATIYSGMTHLTLLQRKIDADLVATDNVLLPEFIENLLEGYIIPADYFSRYDYIEQVEDGAKAMPEFTRNGDDMTFSGWAKPAEEVYTKTEIDNKFTVANAQIDANSTAIVKTRDDMNAEDSRLQTQITAHAGAITALQNEQTATGNQIQTIESKIPDGTSDTNPLINKQQLLDEEMDIREDMNESDSQLQSQITAQAAAIATLDSEKLDKNQGDINAGKYLVVGNDGNIELTTSGGGGGGGIGVVNHDETLTGNGTDANPLKVSKKLSLEKVSVSDGTRDVLSAMSTNMAKELFPDQTFFGEGTTITSQWALDNPDINRLEFLTPITFHGWMPDVAEDIAMKPISAWSLVSGYQVLENFVSFTTTSSQTMAGALTLPELTVETPEGALNISVTAGVATIATNNGLDIASQTKFDTAPTTDDNTTWEDALDTSLVRKAQVAAAIGSAASITIRNWQ